MQNIELDSLKNYFLNPTKFIKISKKMATVLIKLELASEAQQMNNKNSYSTEHMFIQKNITFSSSFL